MTYAVSSALQTAIYQHILADTAVSAFVGSNVFDALPSGALPNTYISLGPEEARDASDGCSDGAIHDFLISVVTDTSGFQSAKEIAAAVCDALNNPTLTLSRGHLIDLWFQKAKASRSDDGSSRRIDLTFRARVQDS